MVVHHHRRTAHVRHAPTLRSSAAFAEHRDSILAEYPSLRIIDDNAMMTLVPLGAALLLQPFFSQQTVA